MRNVYITGLLISFLACGGTGTKENRETEQEPLAFKMISIPAIYTDPADRAEFLVNNYWDNFDFSDTRFLERPDIVEQAMVDYLDVMRLVPYETASASLSKMMKKAEADSTMFSHFAGMYEKYLHDPNSPMMNEELYIPVLQAIMASSVMDNVDKVRPAYQLEIALKNRIGEKGNDITYTLANGRKGSLYTLSAEYILLYFFNPDCSSCKEITAELSGSPVVNQRLSDKSLKILSVYPDEDLTA